MEAEAEVEAGMEAYDRSNYCSSHYFCDFDINLCSIKGLRITKCKNVKTIKDNKMQKRENEVTSWKRGKELSTDLQ